MLKKVVYIIIIFFINACSGEKYDLSRAVSILPEKSENLMEDHQLSSLPVDFTDISTYNGNLAKKTIFKLKNIISNFAIKDGIIYYVNKDFNLIGIDEVTKKTMLKTALNDADLHLKKKNINFVNLTISGEDALIMMNTGYIACVSLYSGELNWKAYLMDLLFNRIEVINDRILISLASGGLYIMDKKNGEQLFYIAGFTEDQLSTNFNTNTDLTPLKMENHDILIGYYKTDLLFFDYMKGSKAFTIPLLEGALNFARITTEPIIFRNFIIGGTSKNLVAISLSNGIKAWELNAYIASNILSDGNFIFVADSQSENLLALSGELGSVKWKTSLSFKKYSKLNLIPRNTGTLLGFTEKGNLIEINGENGELENIKYKNFYSPRFDYMLYKSKIYYTDARDNVIVLQ